MKLPRDLTGTTLAALLQRHYGYAVSRQRGSHLTVTVTSGDSEYSVTIPRHRQLRVGTLSSILAVVAGHQGVSKEEVRRVLFGR